MASPECPDGQSGGTGSGNHLKSAHFAGRTPRSLSAAPVWSYTSPSQVRVFRDAREMGSATDDLVNNVVRVLSMSRQIDLRMIDQLQKCAHDWEREGVFFSAEDRRQNKERLQPLFAFCSQLAS